tara:strand:- start:4244 stop:4888 length:645 start_codon:yes stop_codon:yes gene_type:complete
MKIITTNDGSHSLYNHLINERYHSVHGAISESMHVFINEGMKHYKSKNLKILEIGFGTGLNTFLTLENMGSRNIQYTTLEPFPVNYDIIKKLNYSQLSKNSNKFLELHRCIWNKKIKITNKFIFYKHNNRIQDFITENNFNIIYFDAFSPNRQSEIWEYKVLKKCYNLLSINGFLVTYCAKGVIKRRLKKVGFKIEILSGPPGKREMIRAVKIN